MEHKAVCTRRRGGRSRGAVVTLVTLAVLAGAMLGAAPASALNPAFHADDDWKHAWAVLDAFKKRPPGGPVVYLFGGSAARECTVNDRHWRDQLSRLAGRKIRVRNLAASKQSFFRNIDMVRAMPDVPSIVLIGINLGRFMSPEQVAGRRPDPPLPSSYLTDYTQHRFTDADVLSTAGKRLILRDWVTRRYPVFKRRYDSNYRQLGALIRECQSRGFHPVLVNMPFNNAIVRPALDRPRAKYAAGCRALADKYDIPYYDFAGRVHLVNRDFIDLWHCIRPGRVKYQRRLSEVTHRLLDRYGMGG